MAKALSEHQLNGFHYHIEEGWKTRDAARKVGIPYNFSTFIAAEYRNRKPVQIEQINEFETQLEDGCTTAEAAETAGIPFRLASFIAAEYRKQTRAQAVSKSAETSKTCTDAARIADALERIADVLESLVIGGRE